LKDGLSEGEGVGVARFFSRKILVTKSSNYFLIET